MITGVDFVSVPTTDLARAMDFYGEVLGLERSSVWQRSGHPAVGVEFETGTVTLAVVACDELGIEFEPNRVPIALQVADVATIRGQLESKGVEFAAETIDSGVCHMAHFKDPDGNVLMLHHRYAPKARRE
jgi:predicted enzyme related to lactoylglutathione lyase